MFIFTDRESKRERESMCYTEPPRSPIPSLFLTEIRYTFQKGVDIVYSLMNFHKMNTPVFTTA